MIDNYLFLNLFEIFGLLEILELAETWSDEIRRKAHSLIVTAIDIPNWEVYLRTVTLSCSIHCFGRVIKVIQEA